jgi:peroxiredoxin
MPPLRPGALSPAVAALDGDTPVELSSLAGPGPALLFFYKGACAACAVAAPVLARFGAIPGLRVAAVSQDTRAETDAFAAANGWPGAVHALVDPEPWPASDAFEIAVTPTWVLVSPEGRIDAVAEGFARDDANALAARAAVLAGASPRVVSRPEDVGPALRPG